MNFPYYLFWKSGIKSNAIEFMQYRLPVGSGPSSKIHPKWPSHLPQRASMRATPNELSFLYTRLLVLACSKKLGQPQELENFAPDQKSLKPQAAQ